MRGFSQWRLGRRWRPLICAFVWPGTSQLKKNSSLNYESRHQPGTAPAQEHAQSEFTHILVLMWIIHDLNYTNPTKFCAADTGMGIFKGDANTKKCFSQQHISSFVHTVPLLVCNDMKPELNVYTHTHTRTHTLHLWCTKASEGQCCSNHKPFKTR